MARSSSGGTRTLDSSRRNFARSKAPQTDERRRLQRQIRWGLGRCVQHKHIGLKFVPVANGATKMGLETARPSTVVASSGCRTSTHTRGIKRNRLQASVLASKLWLSSLPIFQCTRSALGTRASASLRTAATDKSLWSCDPQEQKDLRTRAKNKCRKAMSPFEPR